MSTAPEIPRPDGSPREWRLVVLAPTGKDARLTCAELRKLGIDAVPCTTIACLAAHVQEGVGALLVSEEALDEDTRPLVEALRRQPPWSDIPVLVLTMHGADSPGTMLALQLLGNVVLLERPLRVAALASACRAALRARERQYQLRSYLAERERQAEALAEASRRKDEFLALLAHELRNPLAPIRSSLEVLRITGSGDAATSHVREMMERQVDHLVRLVDDLMEVSRITRGKVELRMEPTDVLSALRSALESAEPLVHRLGHRLHVDVPAEPLVVHGDAVRLAQVFGNLLHNAAKFTPANGRIALTARREGESIVVRVADSGTGIAAETLPRVFDMFMQGGQAPGATSGLGLGLTLVRSLVEMHGGHVEARSEGPGRGAEFIVTLPEAGDVLPAEWPALAAAPSLASHSVLIVDDNRDAAESLALLLRALGATVRVADGGVQAIEQIRAQLPDVAFVDIGMPGMDGYEVARRVRCLPGTGAVKLVALTGWGQDEDRRRSREAGFDHHLIKPTSLSALQGLLAEG